MKKVELNADVVIPAGGKATFVMVKFGPLLVARATLGGRWNGSQALAELRKQPKRFTLVGDAARSILASQGIAA